MKKPSIEFSTHSQRSRFIDGRSGPVRSCRPRSHYIAAGQTSQTWMWNGLKAVNSEQVFLCGSLLVVLVFILISSKLTNRTVAISAING